MGARLPLAICAVLVLGWTGVLLRDFEIGGEPAARALLGADIGPAERARDRERLRAARLLDPSSFWALAHALNLIRSGDMRAAAREGERLVRDEPESTAAWQLLRAATREIDPRRSAQAAARLRALDPQG